MQFFDISTTVDPSYIISLIRKLLPPGSASQSSLGDGPNRTSCTGNEEEGAAPSVSNDNDECLKSSKNKSENMDVDDSGELSRGREECQDTGNGEPGDPVEDEAWEEYGCILWDLAASKTHAELMVH